MLTTFFFLKEHFTTHIQRFDKTNFWAKELSSVGEYVLSSVISTRVHVGGGHTHTGTHISFCFQIITINPLSLHFSSLVLKTKITAQELKTLTHKDNETQKGENSAKTSRRRTVDGAGHLAGWSGICILE